MSVQNLKGLTQSEADTEIRGWKQTTDNSQRRSGLREQFRFTTAEKLYGHKSKLIVFRLFLDLFNLNHKEIHHSCTSGSWLRRAQYCNWPLGVTASPVTCCAELMEDELVDGLFQFTFRERGFEIRFSIYT